MKVEKDHPLLNLLTVLLGGIKMNPIHSSFLKQEIQCSLLFKLVIISERKDLQTDSNVVEVQEKMHLPLSCTPSVYNVDYLDRGKMLRCRNASKHATSRDTWGPQHLVYLTKEMMGATFTPKCGMLHNVPSEMA